MKKIITTGLCASVLVGLIAAPTISSAATADNKKASTKTGISFEGDQTIEPGPHKGNLSMVSVPTEFSFGKHKAVAGAQKFKETKVTKKWLVVNDDREIASDKTNDPKENWKLEASLDNYETTAKAQLPASVTFTSADKLKKFDMGALSVVDGKEDYTPSAPSDDPTTGNIKDLATQPGIAITPAVKLTAGGDAVKVLEKTAKDKEEKGAYALNIDNVFLETTIGDASKVSGKAFTSTINWLLTDAY